MFRPLWKLLLIGAVAAAAWTGGAMEADACWAWGGCRPTAYASYSVPTYTATHYYDPCGYTTCGYYLSYRPGPLRRLLFGRYRWHYGCWTMPIVTYDYPVGYTPVVVAPRVVPRVEPEPAPREPEPEIPEPLVPMPPIPEPEVPDILIPEPDDPEPAIPQPQPIPEPAVPLVPEEPAPAVPPAAVPDFDFDPPEPNQPGTTYVPKPGNSGLLTVWVPHDARVIVNDFVTQSTGSRRQFVSYGLQPGYSYTYEIRAQLVRDGKIIEDVRTVILTAGQDRSVAFGFPARPAQTLASQW